MNNPTHVLIVEDSKATATLISTYLHDKGFTYSVTDTLAVTLSRLTMQPQVDAILLDLILPDSQGPATLTTVFRAFPKIPIVVITGDDRKEVEDAVMRGGAEDFIKKSSVTPDQLEHALRYAILRHDVKLQVMDECRPLRQAIKIANETVAAITSTSANTEKKIVPLIAPEPLGCIPNVPSDSADKDDTETEPEGKQK